MGGRAEGRLLDLTRLVSRSGRVLTGVDRVELAYAEHLSRGADPAWGLVRTAYGFLLLDGSGVAAIAGASRSGDWGRPDLLSRLKPRLGRKRQAGQSFARARAIGRSRASGLAGMLARALPEGVAYLNLGHSNFDARVFRAVKAIPAARIACMIHDTIPLDFPEFQRDGSVAEFAAKLRLAGEMADVILTPSEASAASIRQHLGDPAPDILAAHLGVAPPPEGAADVPPPFAERPYFVALGTIEPRKNHALLLDIWEEMAGDGPGLAIVGRRGWKNAEVFRRLDAGVPGVRELGALNDAEVSALLKASSGLVFPSLAEGFGLPPVEAAMLGVPVLASDLPVLREMLGTSAVYLEATDRYQWKKTIQAMAANPEQATRATGQFVPPTWEAHFKTTLSVT